MRRRKLGSHPQQFEEPQVNLTPLIDVVFSILIMFIVVAPLLDLDRVDLAEGNGEQKEEAVTLQNKSAITIHVHQDNTVWLNQRMVELAEIPALLKQEKRRHPQTTPQLFHDKRAQFGIYQTIKNSAEVAGFEELEIILKPA